MAADRPSEPAPALARRLLALVGSRPATLGESRLVCIDGPAGSGKTTLAAAVAALSPEARVVHMDDLYDGWDGLPRVGEQLETLLTPLAGGRPGSYRRYDWRAGRYAETVTVPPAPLLVLEGVGSFSPAFEALVTLLVWVDGPARERLARAIARDGAAMADHLRAWAGSEREHFARAGTRERADLVLVLPPGP